MYIMKKAFVLLLTLLFTPAFVLSAPKKMIPTNNQGSNALPHIFIYKIPDTDFQAEDIEDEQDAKESDYNNDVTSVISEDEPIILENDEDNEDEIVLGATVLKGYAQYVEDSDAIYLRDEDNKLVLNIKTPQKISASKGLNLSDGLSKKNKYTSKGSEYFIAPNSYEASSKIGNFTIGAQYNNEIDKYAMLETEAGLFTKYEIKKFALSSSVSKSLDTTYAGYSNIYSISPELKLNDYISIKNTFSSNTTYQKHSYQLMLTINPFGKKEKDRWSIEVGAKGTHSELTDTTSSQLLFSTKFKL